MSSIPQAAFKIRGLSRRKLASLKAQNVTLLREGVLEVPFCLDNVKIPTLYRLQGTDILTDEQVQKAISINNRFKFQYFRQNER